MATPATAKNSLPAIPADALLGDDAITKLLRQSGEIATPTGGINRIKVDGAMFIAGDDLYPYNPATKKPAFIARLVGPLVEYQGLWFSDKEAAYANSPERNGKYCKSYFKNPEQARETSNLGYACRQCPVGIFVKRDDLPSDIRKCSWRGELEVQIMPPSMQLDGTEPIWTIDLSTTAVIEFTGTGKNPQAGHVSPYNFKHKLAMLAQKQAVEAGEPAEAGILRALTAYHNGGVVAEFRLLGMPNSDLNYRVISLEPIAIIDVPEAPALASGGAPEPDYDDLPF